MPASPSRLFHLFTAVVPTEALAAHACLRLKSSGFLDLVVETLYRRGNLLTISAAHYYQQNGDLVAEVDLEAAVDVEHRTLMPLAIQTPWYYMRVADRDDQGRERVHSRRLRDLQAFAAQWFSALAQQGFVYRAESAASSAGDNPKPGNEP